MNIADLLNPATPSESGYTSRLTSNTTDTSARVPLQQPNVNTASIMNPPPASDSDSTLEPPSDTTDTNQRVSGEWQMSINDFISLHDTVWDYRTNRRRLQLYEDTMNLESTLPSRFPPKARKDGISNFRAHLKIFFDIREHLRSGRSRGRILIIQFETVKRARDSTARIILSVTKAYRRVKPFCMISTRAIRVQRCRVFRTKRWK